MTRRSSEEWEKEQSKDGDGLVTINLESIENGVLIHRPDKMLAYEIGKADYKKITDLELCTELDALARNRYGKHSVYQLSLREKQQIAEYLHQERHLGESQIRRCLVLFK
jgi:hypothetical protein